MTLIITAICNDGICVCADKRRQIKYSDGRIEIKDNLYKIYKFENTPIIIFNHAINIINGKFWDLFCSEYEKSERWKGLEFEEIVDDFKEFIEYDVLTELKTNNLDNAIGFVLCGTTSRESNFQVYELFWSPRFERKVHRGLVRTGTGAKYLNEAIKVKPEINTIRYWSDKIVVQAQEEIRQLFSHAVQYRKNCNAEEFSDNFDVEIIKI